MLVYGDPQFQTSFGDIFYQIQRRADGLKTGSFEDLRALLIQLGQLEQAVADSPDSSARTFKLMSLTDLAATAFCAALQGKHTCDALRTALQDTSAPSLHLPTMLTVTVPEGFAFYALFPEQYVLAAQDWVSAHREFPSQRVLVIGLRSIGTTLSAVVAATLRSLGWETQRMTVRPSGDPFRREVEINPAYFEKVDWAVVIDEGPGASGSSMAAVAANLCRMGLSPAQISFFPGHPHGPGASASAETLSWWRRIRSYHAPLERVQWSGCSLQQVLAIETHKLLKVDEPIEAKDVSAGQWRESVFASTADWPPIASQFERMKFLFQAHDGGAILWKFCGLAFASNSSPLAESVSKEMARRAKQTTSPAPLLTSHGFIAVPWIAGIRWQSFDARDAQVLQTLANYIAVSAGKPLTPSEAQSGFDRLSKMLVFNTKEFLGEDVAALARSLSETVTLPKGVSRYGDGQMSPHEWVRTAEGRIAKTNCAGHDCDHTLVGPQPIHWDVAGTMVEWDLKQTQGDKLIESLDQHGFRFAPLELTFYTAAYAAFRLGLCRLATTFSDATECRRLERAAEHYLRRLQGALSIVTSPIFSSHIIRV